MDRIDILLDDGARVAVLDALHEDIGIQFAGEVTHLDTEIGFGEDDIDFDVRELLFEAAFEIESAVAGVGSREGGYLYAKTRNGLHFLVEFDMFLHEFADLHIAGNLHLPFLTLGVEGAECKECRQGKYDSFVQGI